MRSLLHPARETVALIDASTGRSWTHAELSQEVEATARRLEGARSVVLCRAALTPGSVVGYLGALAAGHAVALVDDALDPDALDEIVRRYEPRFVLTPDGVAQELDVPDGPEPHPDLALLLSTSGTTGSPKLVRLSANALLANARAIATYLELDADERAIASLPLHYCYGLSVLHSHLYVGGSVVLPAGGLTNPAFWEAADRYGCTSLAGVPHSYALLRTMGRTERPPATLRTMTQAGGRLHPDVVRELAGTLRRRSGRFFVMYGQTEATARMAYLPPEQAEVRPDSIGIPIPGGRLEVDASGELVYRGENVMMGYATERVHLALGDERGGVLRTGDLGHQDDEGFFYLTGRVARFAKPLGLRVSLDEVEQALPWRAAAVERDERVISVFVEGGEDPQAVRALLARRFRLPPRTFDVRDVDELPVTGAGKVDYARLRST